MALKPESRYRRRVLAAGGLAAFAAYVLGAPIFNNRIENDLEHRVPEALAAAGFGDVTVKFSGQDGTIACSAPLSDPEAALDAAYDVHGVHRIELERACRVSTGSGSSGSSPTTPSGGSDAASGTTGGATTPGDDPAGTSVPGYDTVGDVVTGDALFSSLAIVASGSGLAAELADPAAEPVTVFAPSDEAFDAVSPEVAGLLNSDDTARDALLRRHIVRGALTLDELTALAGGDVTALDGTALPVVVAGGTITVAGATVDRDPIETPTGVVYAIDQVLLPDDITARTTTAAPVAATLQRGRITLTGAVANDAGRAALMSAAAAAVGPFAVADELTVDPASGIDEASAGRLATLVATLRTELVAGEAGFDGSALYLTGRYADQAAADAAEAAAAAVGATAELEQRPIATADQAAALEAELNEFVAANPILFQPGSAVLELSASVVIDRVAAGLAELGGLGVVVAGHTDSDGTAAVNQALSEQRAATVRQALIDRGVDPATIASAGFGSREPVLVNGLEDKTASRRVEFRITVA